MPGAAQHNGSVDAHAAVAAPSQAFLHHAGQGAASTLGEALGGDGLAEYWYSEPPSTGSGFAAAAKHDEAGAFAAEADFGGEPLPDDEGAASSSKAAATPSGAANGSGNGNGRFSATGGVAELAALDAAHAAGELPPAHAMAPMESAQAAPTAAAGPGVHDVSTSAYDAQAVAAGAGSADGEASHADARAAHAAASTPISSHGVVTPLSNGSASHESADGSPFEFVCLEHVLVTMAARQHKRVAYAGRVLETMLNRVSTVQKDDSRLLALFPLGNTLAHYELVSRGLMECVRALLEDARDMREACLTEKGKRAAGELHARFTLSAILFGGHAWLLPQRRAAPIACLRYSAAVLSHGLSASPRAFFRMPLQSCGTAPGGTLLRWWNHISPRAAAAVAVVVVAVAASQAMGSHTLTCLDASPRVPTLSSGTRRVPLPATHTCDQCWIQLLRRR